MGVFDVFKKNSNSISNKERMRKIRQSGKDGDSPQHCGADSGIRRP